jgi:hypothetical protein
MRQIFECFETVCSYETTRTSQFSSQVKVSQKCQKAAIKLLKDEEKTEDKMLIKCTSLNYKYKYTKSATCIYTIDKDECSCVYFQKYAMCHHFAAVAILERVSLRNMIIAKVLIVKRRRRLVVEEENEEDDPRIQAIAEAISEIEVPEGVVQPAQVEPVRRRPGRPAKKATQQLTEMPPLPRALSSGYRGNLRSTSKALSSL